MFTIVIPTWNNLSYLKLCIDSIRKYSRFDHEVIVHVNDGSDGTLDWVKSQELRFSHSEKNVGVCLALNHLVSLASHDWVLYLNDDMVACPGWDNAFAEAIASIDTDLALFFGTLIQQENGKNPHIIKQNFGASPADFDESNLIKQFMTAKMEDAEGVGSQPTLFHKKWWNSVGGYSIEFSPGMSSDDDLLMKYWVIGCRHYRLVGASRFYHFSCASTGRIRHNKGGRIFAMKWGITQKEFVLNYLSTLGDSTANQHSSGTHAASFPRTTFKGRIRRAGYGLFHEYPLNDIESWDPAAGAGAWDESAARSTNNLVRRPSRSAGQPWLILSHAFNMDGRAASQTITDKIPHLVNLGIEPIIISGVLGTKDRVLEHHQVLSALPAGLRFDLRHYLKNRIHNHLAYQLTMLLVTLLLSPFYLLEKIFIPIETTWSWAISAYLTGRRIIQSRRPAIVYSTGGAYAAHIAGYWLSRCSDILWIAEIHDPMVIESNTNPNIRQRFLMWLEKKICTHADLVWWFTETAMTRARQRYPQLGQRGHYVLPGVDAPDFMRTPYRRHEQMVISHFGSLSPTRNLQVFLDALREFIRQAPERASRIRLHIFGASLDPISAKAIDEFPYPDVIRNFGRLEMDPVTGESGRTQVLKRMNAADCLLLLHGAEPACEEYIPSKLYEYLWTQRPILGLIHRNAQLTGLLHEFNHWAVDSQDVAEVGKALENIYQRWEQDRLKDNQIDSPYTTRRAVETIVNWTEKLARCKSRIE